MRSDMAKVLCEEPRRGMRVKDRKGWKRKERRVADEDKPVKEQGNLRAKWVRDYWDHKEFGDHVQPLRRYVLSCVGRKWDDVYSEIRKQIPKGTVVNDHVYTHLFQYVALNVRMIDGKPHESEDKSRFGLMPVYQDTYVDPNTGLLCKNKDKNARYRSRYQGPKEGTFFAIDERSCYVKDSAGIWWHCQLKKFNAPTFVKSTLLFTKSVYYGTVHDRQYDVHLHEIHTDGDIRLKNVYNTSGMYCYLRRQVGKREIRKFTKRVA